MNRARASVASPTASGSSGRPAARARTSARGPASPSASRARRVPAESVRSPVCHLGAQTRAEEPAAGRREARGPAAGGAAAPRAGVEARRRAEGRKRRELEGHHPPGRKPTGVEGVEAGDQEGVEGRLGLAVADQRPHQLHHHRRPGEGPEIGADPRVGAGDRGLVEGGQVPARAQAQGRPDRVGGLEGATETSAAPLGPGGEGPQEAVVRGEELDDPVALAVVDDPQDHRVGGEPLHGTPAC